jgi:hypothetical protein
LLGELDELRIAASVRGDQDPEHFQGHRVDLPRLRTDVPCLYQRGLRVVPVAKAELSASSADVDGTNPDGR